MSALYRTLTGQSQKSEQTTHTTNSTVSQARPTVTRTTTTDPLTGTLNHLTTPQLHKLDEFKEKLQKTGWWAPDGINGKPTHDDGTLLRYLRARKFDVQGAIGQFTDTEKWLKQQKVEELYDNFDVGIYENSKLLYPQWTGHRDRRGIPIYVYVIKGLDSKHVNKHEKESKNYKNSLPSHKKIDTPAKMLPLFALYQNLLTFVLPFVSVLERPNPEVPVTNSTNIVDISGVGLTQFWNLKNHMQDASVLATAHYPETLDRIFIIGAPSFFPTVWGWIKRWFDPVTVSKIFILGKNEVKPTLSRFMDPKDFPKRYGGDLKWDWGDMPDLDDETRAALERDGNKGWVRGPCLWLDGKRVQVGSEGGKPRRPNFDIEKMKPVIYAADYTETPVHPSKKHSISSKTSSPPQTAHAHHKAEEEAVAATGGATLATLVATHSNSEQEAQVPKPVPAPEPESQALLATEPVSVPPELHSQATMATEPVSAPPQPQPAPVPVSTEPVPAQSGQGTTSEPSHLLSAATYAQAPAMPATANGNANGHVKGSGEGHPEIIVSNDASEGLATEAEKMKITDDPKAAGLERPAMERFVTAVEGL